MASLANLPIEFLIFLLLFVEVRGRGRTNGRDFYMGTNEQKYRNLSPKIEVITTGQAQPRNRG